jgi:hypothetical protein
MRFAVFGQALVRISAVQRAAGGMAVSCMVIAAAATVLAGIVWLSHGASSYGSGETEGVLWTPTTEPARGVGEA